MGDRIMASLKSFSPEHRIQDAQRSGFLQCSKCGLVWFGRPDITTCPETSSHGEPVRVVIVCRECDVPVPAKDFGPHLASRGHAFGVNQPKD